MSNTSPQPQGSASADLPQELTDRVAERVVTARLALERQTRGTRRRAPRGSENASAVDAKTAAEQRETQSLKQVFREMGVSYRRYRSQTGGPVTPGLKDAAYRFRADPSLGSLVAVAAYLDELDLLS